MSADIRHQVDEQNHLILYFSGQLDKTHVASLWQQLNALAKSHVKGLVIDASEVESFDTAGVVFIHQIQHLFKLDTVKYQNFSDDLRKMMEQFVQACEKSDEEVTAEAAPRRSFAASVGAYTMSILTEVYHNLRFTGETTYYLLEAISKPKRVRWKDVWRSIEDVGPNALPIVALLGFLIGLILSFQASVQLQKFGAILFVVNIVGVGMTRELAPLFTAILLSGRTSSSFAAEIGTMKVNQEIDALSTMGLPSVRFLVVPRLIAVTLMLPLLSVFMIFFSLLGCGVFMVANGYPWAIFLSQLYGAVTLSYFWGGFIKAIIFGVLVAAIGCLNGLKTASGASAVGQSTTQAVVSAIVTLVVVDGILAVLFYSIGA